MKLFDCAIPYRPGFFNRQGLLAESKLTRLYMLSLYAHRLGMDEKRERLYQKYLAAFRVEEARHNAVMAKFRIAHD